jgi:pyroglutamyl-peptidase
MIHCVLSGFDAFGAVGTNPSQQAVERVAAKLTLADGRQVRTRKVILPTACHASWKLLCETIRDIPLGTSEEFGLVLSGFAEKRDQITPECYALNVRHYRIADNQGDKPLRDVIIENGVHALKTTVDLSRLLDRFTQRGLSADISYHAGTFVCNEVYYRALHAWGTDPLCVGIVFIHLPDVANYKNVGDRDPLEHYSSALTEAAKLICGG